MSSSAVKDSAGIGKTERRFRTTPREGGGKGSTMKPVTDTSTKVSTDEPQSLPELDGNGNLMPFEVSLRRSSSMRPHQTRMQSTDQNSTTLISYAYATQRGYYPDDPHKHNQDAYSIIESFDGDSNSSFFAVYDGHGPYGDECSKFAKIELPKLLKKFIRQKRVNKFKRLNKERVDAGEQKLPFNPKCFPTLTPEELQDASTKAHLECNRLLLQDPKASLSGTTAISLILYNGQMIISNVGDSRAILGFQSFTTTKDSSSTDDDNNTSSISIDDLDHTSIQNEEKNYDTTITGETEQQQQEISLEKKINDDEEERKEVEEIVPIPMSVDQTAWRKDERERIIAAGGRVLTTDQVDGYETINQNFEEMVLGEELDINGDPPRVWLQNQNVPGTSFTRSIGDKMAETVGVNAVPDVIAKTVTEKDKIVVLASDGVFEFLSNKAVMDICSKENKQPQSDPLEACDEILQASYEQWLNYENRTDDITAIVLFLENNKTPHNPNSDSFRKMLQLSDRKPIMSITENNNTNDDDPLENGKIVPTAT
jgi:serine/threonine protein phosphatase PrpC